MFKDIEQALADSLLKGLVNSAGYEELFNIVRTIYKYLYSGIEDMKEVDIMYRREVYNIFLRYGTEYYKKGIK